MENQIYLMDSDHGPILIEMEVPEGSGRESISRGKKVVEQLKQKFDDALETLKNVGDSVVAKASGMARKPDEFTIELGLKFTAEAGVVVAKAASEGHLKVTLKWKKES